MIKDPHGRLPKNVEKVGEIERDLTTKDTKKTQRTVTDADLKEWNDAVDEYHQMIGSADLQ